MSRASETTLTFFIMCVCPLRLKSCAGRNFHTCEHISGQAEVAHARRTTLAFFLGRQRVTFWLTFSQSDTLLLFFSEKKKKKKEKKKFIMSLGIFLVKYCTCTCMIT